MGTPTANCRCRRRVAFLFVMGHVHVELRWMNVDVQHRSNCGNCPSPSAFRLDNPSQLTSEESLAHTGAALGKGHKFQLAHGCCRSISGREGGEYGWMTHSNGWVCPLGTRVARRVSTSTVLPHHQKLRSAVGNSEPKRRRFPRKKGWGEGKRIESRWELNK